MKPKFRKTGIALPAIISLNLITLSLSHGQTSNWINDNDGVWSNAANWDNGSPNAATFNAIIDEGDSSVAVTLDASRTIDNLTVGSDDSLLFNNNITLSLGGDVTNDGLIISNSLGNTTGITLFNDTTHTFGGSGILRLGSSNQNRIAGTGTLVNEATHTIEGGGSIGLNQIGIDNAGLIRANQSGVTMSIDPSVAGGVTNTGTLRAENGGTLFLSGGGGGGDFDNTGGLIEALADSRVRLGVNADISGGSLSTTGNGKIRLDDSNFAYLSDLSNSGDIVLGNNSTLNIAGDILNSGSISTNSLGNVTTIRVTDGGATLDGGGTVNLQNTLAGIDGVSQARLTNEDNTIRGHGNIGRNLAAITNNADGLIAADVLGQALTLDPVNIAADGGDSFINHGILRAANGGTLLLTGSGGGDFVNNNLIEALDASTVLLQTNATITGGTFSTTGSGQVVVEASDNAFFTGITNTGTMIARNNSDFGVSGTIASSGTIRLTTLGNNTDMEIQAGGATLTGGGTVTLEGATSGINSAATGERLTNVDNTIQGFGRIGQNNTAITNAATGVIDANVAGQTLTLDPVAETNLLDADPSFLNEGILRASNGGILSLTGSGNGDFTNNNLIEALDGSEVRLTTNARIIGGTLATSGTGVFRGMAGQNFDLENLTLDGDLITENNSDLGITGTINNLGSITLTSLGNQTDLEVQAGGATLTGGGKVILADAATGIDSVVNGTRLINEDNTIEGRGFIGQNDTAITNRADGLIDANISGASLTIDPAASAIDAGPSFLNEGVLRASNGGTLILTGSGGGDFTNDNLIEALAGSVVQLTSNASITGGTLSTSGDGFFQANASQNVFLTDLASEGNIVVLNNTDLGVSGNIQNSGMITLTSLGNQTDLEIQAGGATLTGGGEISLADATTGIDTNSSGSRLTNADNTIHGRGSFGQNRLAITNGPEALIDANISGTTMTINPVAVATDAGPSFLNQGVVQASNGGTLSLSGLGGGDFTNASFGTFAALDGSTLNMVSGAVLTNNVAGTLTGGRYIAEDSGNGADLTLLGTPVTNLAADTLVDLSGANSTITFNGTALSQTLTENDGTLRLRDGRVFDNVNALVNSGNLELGGGTFSAPALTNSGTIIGNGNVNVRPSNSGAVIADGGMLVFSDGIAAAGGSSSVTVFSTASLDISAGANSSAATLAHNGTDLNLGTNNISVSSDYTNANFDTGNSFDHRANVSGTGDILATGNTAQTITGDVVADTIDFGNVHVGGSVTKNYAVANTGTTGPALRGAIQTAANGGNITDSRIGGTGATAGNFGPVATGADTGNLGVTFNATSAGALSGQTVHIENNFDNVAGSDIALTGAAYRLASPDVSPVPVDFGIIHVGDAVSQTLSLANNSLADGFSENLNASFAAPSGGITGLGSVSGLAAGATDSGSLSVTVDTSSAGFVSGNAILNVVSDGTGTSGLGTTALPDIAVETMAQINNYAAADYQLLSGAATLTGDAASGFILDFGTVFQGSGGASANLAVANDVTGPADTLSGVFDLLGASGFSLIGFTTFSGIEAGDSKDDLVVTLDTSSIGTVDSSIFLDPRSQNASGFDGELDRVSLTVKGVVAVPEPSSSALVALAFAFAMVRRKR